MAPAFAVLQSKLSTLLREIAWSAHLHILAKTKRIEEKEFYLRKTLQEHYSVRELERQLNSGLFERTILADQQRIFSLQSLPQRLPLQIFYKATFKAY